jgi:hypothetical protein
MHAKLAAAAAAVVALALPSAALALHEGSSGTGHSAHAVVVPSNPLRDGKYLPQPASVTTAPAPVQIVRVIKPRGFDLRDASIGAAFGALLIAIVGTLVLVTLRERAPRVAARTGA